VTLAYLLDTHAALWLLAGDERLGAGARAALESEEAVAISDVSLLEMAMLAKRGVITLAPDSATGLQRIADKLVVLPISARIAAEATAVNLPQRDPFDRVITATAMVHGLILVTKDRAITEANVVSTKW
jgi:PIN domain nuclease of toxin-antitoxin system